MRAEGALDSVLETSSEELASIKEKFGRDLYAAACSTLHSLHMGMEQTEQVYLTTLNETAMTLDSALAPTRDAVRAELEWHRGEQAARQAAKQRAAARRQGFKRAFSWRDTTARSRAASKPKHPVVRVCEVSSLIVSLLLMLAIGDISTSSLAAHSLPSPAAHSLDILDTRPPQRVQRVERTLLEGTQPPAPAVHRPAKSLEWDSLQRARLPRRARTNWWLAMQGPLAVYLATLGVIVMRSSTDEWAALAIGIEPDDPESRLQSRSGYVRFEYDWEREEWRQVG